MIHFGISTPNINNLDANRLFASLDIHELMEDCDDIVEFGDLSNHEIIVEEKLEIKVLNQPIVYSCWQYRFFVSLCINSITKFVTANEIFEAGHKLRKNSMRHFENMAEMVRNIEFDLDDLIRPFQDDSKSETSVTTKVWKRGNLCHTLTNGGIKEGVEIRKGINRVAVLWMVFVAELVIDKCDEQLDNLTFRIKQPASTKNKRNNRKMVVYCEQFESFLKLHNLTMVKKCRADFQ